ncbi:MAG: hypothetical protein KME20_25570 [Kaiparowitsia implicata GSE-PSE-MK54-09C]|nr:hypothetical protein [Kaiparowitsia implicata GSE-PSE-MK54-09C]
MPRWLLSFVVLFVVFFAVGELVPWVSGVALPSPALWLAGLLLAIASNTNKTIGLAWGATKLGVSTASNRPGLSHPSAKTPQTATAAAVPGAARTTTGAPIGMPISATVQAAPPPSPEAVSFTIKPPSSPRSTPP